MPRYNVTICFRGQSAYVIEAETKDEAEEQARKLFWSGVGNRTQWIERGVVYREPEKE